MATHKIKADLDVDGNGDISGTLDVHGDLEAPGIYVGATNTSFDFYNNGTSYLNGATTLDANTQINGTLTVGVDDTGYDVKFFGDASGEYMFWDTSSARLEILHTDESVGLEVYTNAAASTTQPQIKVGRSSAQYWGVYTDDRNAHAVHRQDETSGTMTTRFDQWDSNTSDTTGAWEWRFGGGDGSNMDTALTLKQNGDMYMRATAALYMDNGGDTYIQESAANTLLFATGGTARLTLNSTKALFAAEVEAGSLDINGNADISGNLTMSGNGNVVMGTGQLKFADGGDIYLGDSNDLKLYHDGSNSYIEESGTGNLKIRTSALNVMNAANSENMISATENGAVTLYYDNASKLTTASGGINVTGTITSTGQITGTELEGTSLDINGDADIAGTLSLDDTLTVNHATATSQLFLTGTGNGYVNAAVVLQCNDDNGHTRGAGVYMNNVVGATEWFAGRPYSDGDSYQILRRHTTSGNHNNSTATAATSNTVAVMDIDSGGNVVFAGQLAGTSLDINGNADISGNLTGVDTLTATTFSGDLNGTINTATTATTQSASNNSTKVATTAYVDTAVSNLIDGAPGTLDTLNELAEALNDDDDAVVTLTNSITANTNNITSNNTIANAALPKAGGTMTGNITFGSGLDILMADNAGAALEFKEGSNLYMRFITTNGSEAIQMEKATTISNSLQVNALTATTGDFSGNVAIEDEIHLTDGGSTVRGKLLLNSSDRDNVELRAESLGSTMKFFTVGTEALLLDASQNATFAGNVTAGSNHITAASFYVQGTYPRIYLADTDSNDDYSIINNNGTFLIYNDTDSSIPLAIAGDNTATFAGDILVNTATSGRYIQIDHSDDSLKLADNNKAKFGTGNDLHIYHDGDHSIIDNNTGDLKIICDSDDIKILAADDVVIRDHDDSTEMAKFRNGGAVELYHDGSKKLATKSDGVDITGELQADTLDIDGNADISGNLSGVDTLTATTFVGALTGNASGSSGSCTGNAATATEATSITATANNSANETVYPTFVDGATGTQGIETDTGFTYNPSSGTLTTNVLSVASGITHDGDINNKIVFTTDVQTFSCDGNEGLILRGDAVTDSPLAELSGAGAGNQLNIGLLMKGTTNGNPIKLKMQAPPAGGGNAVGAGILSFEPDTDTFNIGQDTSHGSMAISINDNDQVTLTNVATLSGGFILDGNTITGVNDSGEFDNDDAHIMTSAGIEDKILGYSYTTNTGDATLSGTQTFSGAKTFSAAVTVSNSTASSSKTTGAVKVTGGVGIQGALNVGGDVTAFASSDERYKDNLQAITNPIDKVKSLTGYTFTWNDKHEQFNGNDDIGVVAQEVEKVLPEIVDTRDNGYKAVKYEKMVALLIEAVKDQQKQIDELKEKCNGCS